MSDSELWYKGEKQISLHYVEEDFSDNITEISRCLKALRELEHIVKPLSFEFGVKCQNLKNLSYSFEIKPEVSYWHWEISPVPEGILTLGMYTGIAKVIPVNDISIDSLQHWIEEPLQQQCPDPNYKLRWSEMNIYASKAKVFDEYKFTKRKTFTMILNSKSKNLWSSNMTEEAILNFL